MQKYLWYIIQWKLFANKKNEVLIFEPWKHAKWKEAQKTMYSMILLISNAQSKQFIEIKTD